ncbi:MAG: hypothetical protein LBP81_05305, partial [Treponema sp.]|nr:hypothetical protein [Treponema sp.]
MRHVFFLLPVLCILFLAVVLYGESPGTMMEAPNLSRDAPREYAVLLARSLNDRELAAQVLLTGIDGKGALGDSMKVLLKRIPAGGILL